tara:strand:- start:5052 stop:5189 length:138 start_codon:yes stop_codon:yes gene_type:complete
VTGGLEREIGIQRETLKLVEHDHPPGIFLDDGCRASNASFLVLGG